MTTILPPYNGYIIHKPNLNHTPKTQYCTINNPIILGFIHDIKNSKNSLPPLELTLAKEAMMLPAPSKLSMLILSMITMAEMAMAKMTVSM